MKTRTKTSTEPIFALGLGSNQGRSEAQLFWALQRLEALLGPFRTAPLYRSAPISSIPQKDYLNTVVVGPVAQANAAALTNHLESTARWLLRFTKDLERQAGRKSGPRFGPRVLDIDLLFCGNLVCDDPESATPGELWLQVPHPRLRERRFVLDPLMDLIPDHPLPPDGTLVRETAGALGPEQNLRRVDWHQPPAGWTTVVVP